MNRTGAVALIFITGVAILGAGRLRTAVTPAAAQAPAAGQFARVPRASFSRHERAGPERNLAGRDHSRLGYRGARCAAGTSS